jgi:hypothetical protein
MDSPLSTRSAIHILILLAVLWPGQTMFAQGARALQPYLAQNKLYALQKPAGWKVAETAEPNFFRVLINSPDGASAVDFSWIRNNQGGSNAVRYLAAYRQFLSRTWPDVTFTDARASRDNQRAVAAVTFHIGGNSIRGKYYFESNPRTLSAQGFFAPENLLPSQRALLLNVMASMAFIKNDRRPAASGPEPQFYRPSMAVRTADDRSLSVKIPTDWDFMAGGGKVISGGRSGGPGFIFTSLEGNPMLPGAPIAQGVIGSRYLAPHQTLGWILKAFGHRNIRIESSRPDVRTSQELAMRIRRQGDAQDVTAYWTSSGGMPCVGVFKVINAHPSMTGLWFTILAGIWAPERDSYLYLPALDEVASSFSINDQYAKEYIRAGLARLHEMQKQTDAAIRDLNRAREQNQLDWEDRQRRKEFSDSKWDDYRRGNSYWVSDLEGGKVYATDTWGTRDTVTGDYYEGGGYNWTNFEGENPRYRESMREVSSYELKQMGG